MAEQRKTTSYRVIDNMGVKSVKILFFLTFSNLNCFLILALTSENVQPNVLFIIVDDLRPVLGCYGDREAFTPNIDSLAKNSYVFTKVYAQQALCGPSRTSLLTSRSPHHLKQYDVHQYWRVAAGNFTSLPQYFQENGYHTVSVGKVFHPGKCSNFSDDQPFSWSQRPFHPKTEKHKNDPVCPSIQGTGPARCVVCPVNVQDQPSHTLPDLESIDAAKTFLQKHAKGSRTKPFFLSVGFHKPHIPLKFPKEFLEYHPLESIALPSMRQRPPGLPSAAWNPWNDMRRREDIGSFNISFPWGVMPDYWSKKIKQSYYASVSYVDHLVGQLLAKLDELDLRDNTVILLTSDHGWSLGEHGEWSKYSNYEVSTRVPLILSVPGRGGHHISSLVELVDIFPTLVDLVGIPRIQKCWDGYTQVLCTDGLSLTALMNDSSIQDLLFWREGAFSQYPRPETYPSIIPDSDQPRLQEIKVMGYSIRTSNHRYTEWVSFDAETLTPNWNEVIGCELYDHRIDSGENLNLSDREPLKPLINFLRESLKSRWTS